MRKEEGGRRKEEGGRRKQEGGRRKEEGERRKEEGGRRNEERGRKPQAADCRQKDTGAERKRLTEVLQAAAADISAQIHICFCPHLLLLHSPVDGSGLVIGHCHLKG